jgi:hypothetical protein
VQVNETVVLQITGLNKTQLLQEEQLFKAALSGVLGNATILVPRRKEFTVRFAVFLSPVNKADGSRFLHGPHFWVPFHLASNSRLGPPFLFISIYFLFLLSIHPPGGHQFNDVHAPEYIRRRREHKRRPSYAFAPSGDLCDPVQRVLQHWYIAAGTSSIIPCSSPSLPFSVPSPPPPPNTHHHIPI